MKLLQYEIWHECPNNCKFCSLGDGREKISNNEKIENIKGIIKDISFIDWEKFDELAIIGGELNIKLKDSVLHEIEVLIDLIIDLLKKNFIKKFHFMTSLLNNGNVLPLIISKFKENNIINKLSVNTSYDTMWRFNKINRKIWEDNINFVLSNNVHIHIEIILTGDFIDKFLYNNKEVLYILDTYDVDFIRPTFTADKDKEDMPYNFFPKRSQFIMFLKKLRLEYMGIYNVLFHLNRRASIIYSNNVKDSVIRDFTTNNEDISKDTLKCGHSETFAIYSDNNRCSICDIEKFKKNDIIL